jgi:F0F1-type ATP synthase assembly protein I
LVEEEVDMADIDPREQPAPPPTPESRSGGEVDSDAPDWIDSLAQRSSGLPGTSRATKATTKEKSPWRYAGIGLQFLGTTLLFVWIGYELDKRMGWSPWGMVTLAMLSVIGSLYLLIKDVIKENAESERRSAQATKHQAVQQQDGRRRDER